MHRRTFLTGMGALALTTQLQFQAGAAPAGTDPMLAPWTGPYGGLPPFDNVKVDLFGPALEASMGLYRKEIAAIADNPEAPTFENTVVALEKAGRAYNRVRIIFDIYTSTMNDQKVQALELEWSPKFAALADEVVQNAALFKRLQTIYKSLDTLKLTPEQKRLVKVYHTNFELTGASLDPERKRQLSDLNQRLAKLYTRFSQNLLHDEEKQMLVLESQADLAGLPESMVKAAAAEAELRGLKGKWVISNTRSSMEPFLTYADRRDLREKAFKLWTTRGDHPGEFDNNPVVAEIVKLRQERAHVLGFATYADWKLQDTMAKTPARAMDLMMKVWPAAVGRVREEVADMQALARQKDPDLVIEPWDYRYYAEKVRSQKYDLDAAEVKAYLQLENLREALFWASGQLYGYAYKELKGLPTVHPDVRVFEVSREGKPVGLWYFDPYARAGKRSGAWMNEYRTQENFQGPVLPIVSNNSNFVKGEAGKPVLISWDDAETMFHEFGHAIHGLSSQVHYPLLAGTNVARDYVEFPSQVNENWLSTPEVLQRFARHYQSGKPMPDELLARLLKAATFNQGFRTVELLASAIVDMKLHMSKSGTIDPAEFEKVTLKEIGMPREIVMRHRLPQFGHLFSDDGYAAGYYSYLWSEVLDHDCYEAFLEGTGPYDPKVAARLLETILSVGNSVEPADAYRTFRGRDPAIGAYLKAKGFPAQ